MKYESTASHIIDIINVNMYHLRNLSNLQFGIVK